MGAEFASLSHILFENQQRSSVEAMAPGVSCVVKVEEDLRSMVNLDSDSENLKEKEAECWMKRSIYKVPACLTGISPKAYSPQAVSFGPYHHGKDHLQPMEEHKTRAFRHFLMRSRRSFDLFHKALSKVMDDVMACYDQLDQKWRDNPRAFLQLMILDGCFMLEILNLDTVKDCYASNDPLFGDHGKLHIMPYIRRDMLMLENQLPMLVLVKLVAVESGGCKDEEFVNNLILNFYFRGMKVVNTGKCLHVLDIFRKGKLNEFPGKVSDSEPDGGSAAKLGGDEIIRSATELNEAGISFKASDSTCLKDISFSGGVLSLPRITVDDATESMFLNLIAFERFHVGAGNEVSLYIFFMDNIIDNERDVALLHSSGIIQNAVGSNKAVAKLFNSLSKEVVLEPGASLDKVHQAVSNHCRKTVHRWRANLCHTYFRNPWSIASLIAAIFLFALTITQTVYNTVLQYY